LIRNCYFTNHILLHGVGKEFMNSEYHGIILNISQKDKSIFHRLQVIGIKKVLLGLITAYKIRIDSNQISETIANIQGNMAVNIGPFKQGFYAHFYRDNELIIAYKDKLFNITTDHATWTEAILYGKSLNIAERQLDFMPCKFENETY
jgi:hypothetical protein